MHEVELLLTLTGGLASALVLGFITHRLGWSPIVGYLIAGIVVGPYTPGYVANQPLAEQLAEIGVILLMFGVGLQLHFDELLAVAATAAPGAVIASTVCTLLGFAIGQAAGWGWQGSLVFGMAMAVSSTVVLVRVLSDNRVLHTQSGHIAVGWLVMEDIMTVVALVVAPAVLTSANPSVSALLWALGLTAVKVSALVAFAFLVGGRVLPWLLDSVAATRSRELFTLTVLVVALGIAVGSAALFDVSVALGAFLAGMVVGRSDYSLRAASEALPMRDAFAVLFFVSVGMLFDPTTLLRVPGLVVAALGIILVAKPVMAFIIVRLRRHPFRSSLTVAASLSHIGEFSFIFATLGRSLGVLPDEGMHVLVAVSIISIVVNPLVFKTIEPIRRAVVKRPSLWKLLNVVEGPVTTAGTEAPADAAHRAVVVGHGPTGRTVARLLRDNGVEPTVVELNLDTVHALRAGGARAVYGDASLRDTLEAAGVAEAGTLVLTSDGQGQAPEVIRQARELNPKIAVLARTAYLREAATLGRAGADAVFSGEGEVALAITTAILGRLGATPDQIDRERARVHEELLGPATPAPAAAPTPAEPGRDKL